METLKIFDKHLKPTGISKDRVLVHRDGDIHGVVRIHILQVHKHRIQMLLQKRSKRCEAFPGFYDIACAGHIQGQEDAICTAIRELQEELGICVKENDLHFVGNDFMDYSQHEYQDKEYSFLYMYTQPIVHMSLQQEEVDSVEWVDIDDLLPKLDDSITNYCMLKKEVEMVVTAYKTFMKL